MSTLTVGSSMQYTTIASAVAASLNGDVIEVEAGTYVNDFPQINDSITLEAVGGTVTMDATELVPNTKGIIIVGDATHDPNVTIDGFVLEGAKTTVAEGNNAAGIRYQGGNLTLNNDVIENNQDGLLATPYVASTGTIIVNTSTFSANGAGDGQSHNIYVNHVSQFTFEDSVSTNAIVGHDIKSRADNTTIVNSVISDPTGTASYEIDLPNGGNALIENNTIEQGPNSGNPVMISYGEEGTLIAGSTLTVTGNTFLNDQDVHLPTGVRNSTTVVASVTSNDYYGLTAAQLSSGPANISNNTSLAVEPSLPTSGGGAPAPPPAPASLTVSASNTIVHTGTSYTNVQITGDHDGVDVGTGGVNLTSSGASTTVVTLAGETDLIALQNIGYVESAGHDMITTGAGSVTAVATGQDTINAGIGGVTMSSYAGSISSVVGSAGRFVFTGNGALDYAGGAGSADILAGSGAVNVQFGAGATTLQGGSGAANLIFADGTGGGTDVITGFNATRDTLSFQGFTGSAIASDTTSAGSTYLTLTDGTHVSFLHTTSVPVA